MSAQVLKELEGRTMSGLVFHMSKIAFADNTQQRYNSAPSPKVVSMANTTFTPVLVSAGKLDMPEPAIPVAESMSIEREQHFDALALIQHVSEMSFGGRTSTGMRRQAQRRRNF